MLSKSAAKAFFLGGTVITFSAFILLTLDTVKQVPKQTHEENITDSVKRGKDLWDSNNCMGCHTLLGEGAYYAPELTKVYERRGEAFVRAMLKDPQAMFPGQRKMTNYKFSDEEITDLVAFLKWIGEMDLNGFPAKPDLAPAANTQMTTSSRSVLKERPLAYNQMCTTCHAIGGQGGTIGPSLDGVGSRLDKQAIAKRLADPASVKPDTKMPKLPLTQENIMEISAFLSELKASGGAK